MRLFFFIIFIAASTVFCTAQLSFRAIVPQEPVVKGESFQVQYILEGAGKSAVIKPPVFTGFRVVSGPHVYGGRTGSKEISNTVYTLQALKTGRVMLPPAVASISGQKLYSNTTVVDVIAALSPTVFPGNEQGNSAYYLQPGENPYEKIKRNLFVKVAVNKKVCFTGEPVVATFSLYSRLQSRSDIVKNPGFYGFTVYDMVNLADKISGEEFINGQLFTVHTIRKVQLYPLQAGVFAIDPMMIRNTVEFSEKKTDKKTEQEIAEGMLGGTAEEEKPAEGVKVVETETETPAVQITVKPLPEKNKPAVYSGAVGRFEITALTEKNTIAINEEGYLIISISGTGNFIQTDAPAIQWPQGVENFEPVTTDNLNKTTTPLSGSRNFRFPFVCSKAGNYTIPAISFSFFNTDSNKYQTLQSKAVSFTVSTAVKKASTEETNETSIRDVSEKSAKRAAIIVAIIVAAVLLYWVFSKNKQETSPTPDPVLLPTVQELLLPAYSTLESNDHTFYTSLQQCLWEFAGEYFNAGSGTFTKQQLQDSMLAAGIKQEQVNTFYWLLEQCETVLFTLANPEHNKKEITDAATATLEAIVLQKKGQ